jgi:hypothetical protein
MKADWLRHLRKLEVGKTDSTVSARKIVRGVSLTFSAPCDITLEDLGYTKAKMRSLYKGYMAEDSYSAAIELWRSRLSQGKKPGSVGFHCYNHFVKGHATSSRIASHIGPCLQAVTITQLGKGALAVDVFYRSTEFYMKFPADLIFLDEILQPFELPEGTEVTAHFANLALNPMYWIKIAPLVADPVGQLEAMRKADPKYWQRVLKWVWYYTSDHDITKNYAQAGRVKAFTDKRLSADKAAALAAYVDLHYPRAGGQG